MRLRCRLLVQLSFCLFFLCWPCVARADFSTPYSVTPVTGSFTDPGNGTYQFPAGDIDEARQVTGAFLGWEEQGFGV